MNHFMARLIFCFFAEDTERIEKLLELYTKMTAGRKMGKTMLRGRSGPEGPSTHYASCVIRDHRKFANGQNRLALGIPARICDSGY